MNGRRVAIVGVGYSDVQRNSGLTDRQHAIGAAHAALDDAGLTVADIDGVSALGIDPHEAAHMLGMMPLSWTSSVGIAPAFVTPAVQSWAAVASGLADTCLAFRIMMQQPSSAQVAAGSAQTSTGAPGSDGQFAQPFGVFSPVQWAGMLMQRYLHDTDTTEEHFAQLAVLQRTHAGLNPEALMRDPMTVDDYLSARYVSKPLRILDCDYPCDSGSAVIFTTEERARDLRQPAVFVEATALSAIRDLNFEILEDMTVTSPAHCADLLWSRTDLGPGDVDCAQLYDGFTFITMQWLEALGFCPPGQAGPFIAEGNAALGGSLPLNTDGGACNVGRRHGANFCIEATRQLRGQCGDRQVDGADVSVWANAVGPFSGAMLLTND